ncbi:lysophospholipid acyltransferase 5-like [Hypanus sabinus]|uniref:lysophospholipid acyltransferase 5-like n=1 Tax=Hypanus sabinus TaxID=79690 RepID=UPI0028C3F55F|nr:lysophospholipid acyltransferase 5-like [Hypanus sabinus]
MLLGGADDDARLMAAAEEGAAAAPAPAAAPGGWWSLEAAAEQLGASEPALKLFVSIILGYPFAFFHRWLLLGRGAHLVHYYNSMLGLWIAYFNFGWHMLHSLACVVVQFLILRLMGRTVTCVASTFLFQMAYLLAGYYFTATEQYDIKWTMPHCVLTLKLIGQCRGSGGWRGGRVLGMNGARVFWDHVGSPFPQLHPFPSL